MAKTETNPLIHCDSCGEDYSATYRRCPFCGNKERIPRTPAAEEEYVFEGGYIFDEIDRESFNNAVDALIGAKMIYIIGMRSSSSVASFLYHYLNLIFPHVRLVRTTSGSEIFEQILRISEDDVIIGISFPRYSKRIINALEFAKSQSAHVIALTDSAASPIAAPADDILLAKSDMASFVDSLVAPLSIVNALIVAIGKKKQTELSETFERLENIWDEYEVYEKSESDIFGK